MNEGSCHFIVLCLCNPAKPFLCTGGQGWIWQGMITVLGAQPCLTVVCSALQSSLLQCLLGELKALCGNVEVNGRVSYASQTPWVFSGTIKDNILFGSGLLKRAF